MERALEQFILLNFIRMGSLFRQDQVFIEQEGNDKSRPCPFDGFKGQFPTMSFGDDLITQG